jgi:PAT family beta-lactamase induction signal transducer AmpG
MIKKTTMSSINHKMLLFFLGGLSNGLPGVLTWQTLNIWLSQLGCSKSLIGLMFFSGLPYTFKFLLSPIVDHYHVPLIGRYFGKRCGWAISMQIIMLGSLLALSYVTHYGLLIYTAFFCFLTSLCSSINQIATVSHRIEVLDDEETPKGVAIGIVGYRVGKLIGRAGALYLISYLPWITIYQLLSLVLLLSIIMYSTTPEQQVVLSKSVYDPKLLKLLKKKHPFIFNSTPLKHLFCTLVIPFIYFSKSNKEWIKIIALLLLINIGDDLILGMVDLFYAEIGFSWIQIANITKVFGLLCALAGGLTAATLAKRYNTLYGLLFASTAHALSQIFLIILSLKGADNTLLIISVATEYFTSGMKAALVATLISNLCSRVHHTGSQYAFFSSIKAIPLALSSSLSGILIDSCQSWPLFFTLSFLLSLPSIAILYSLPKNAIQKSSYNRINMLGWV